MLMSSYAKVQHEGHSKHSFRVVITTLSQKCQTVTDPEMKRKSYRSILIINGKSSCHDC